MISEPESPRINQFYLAVMKFYEVRGKAIFLKQVKNAQTKSDGLLFGALFKLGSYRLMTEIGRGNTVVKAAVISRFIGQWI